MRGAVFHGAGRVVVEDLLLDPPDAGEIAVRMLASGVCHSDLHVFDGEWERPTDVVMGHEGAGVIEALGEGVADRGADEPLDAGGLRVGDLVVLAWTAPCGACASCLRHEEWLCAQPHGGGHRLAPALARVRRRDGDRVGVYSGIGTFAERQVVAAAAAVPVDPATPPEVAALVGCAVTTGVGAVLNTAAVPAGESVVVIGVGGVGLSVVMGAAMARANPIVAVDVASEKLELARRAGATHAVMTAREAHAAAADEIVALTGGGADHVFEAIGRTGTAELAVSLVRPGGTVTLVGMTPQGDRMGLDVYRFVEDGIVLRGSNYGSAVPARDFPRVCGAYLEGRLPLDLLVTERIGLDGLEQAFAHMRAGSGARRVVLFDGLGGS
jgi:S-(hydroxymethyl)glutathione dehydrogenase/alcohol dehydrogenase